MKKILLLLLFVSGIANAEIPLITPTPYDLCDGDTNGVEAFDLTQKNSEILNGLDPAHFSVQYFLTLTDAENNTNQILNATAYSNLSNPQTLSVRVTELANTANFGTTTLTIRVLPRPFAPAELVLRLCDDNGDGIGTFDLSQATVELDEANPTAIDVAYFETEANAINNINPLPVSYTMTVANVQTLFVRVTNSVGCYVTTTLVLVAGILPTPVSLPNITIYQNPYTGVATFNFLTQREEVLHNQPGTFVLFYPTQADAVANTNTLSIVCYQNTAPSETIWVRIYNTLNNDCYIVTSFDISVVADANPNSIIVFEDLNFETALLQSDITSAIAVDGCFDNMKIDSNSDGKIQTDEAARVFRLDVSGFEIASLDGIEHFTMMNYLNCSNNLLETIDLDGLFGLYTVNCGENLLTTLDFSQTSVVFVHCYNNDLVSVNLKNNIAHELPAESPGNWQGNPDLQTICIDEFETEVIGLLMMLNGYSDVTITSDCALGVPESEFKNPLTIYPNPANSIVNVVAKENFSSVQIVDGAGRIVSTHLADSNELSIDVSGLSQGIYYLKVVTENGFRISKLVKE